MTSMRLPPCEWARPNLLISTKPELIQPAAINAAFNSEFMYWAKPMEEIALKRMLANSLCYGLYDTSSENPGMSHPKPQSTPKYSHINTQIGLACLITDYTTFAYLTDVHILPSHKSQGLGKWLVSSIQEHLNTWPELRGMLLYSDQKDGALRFYAEGLGVELFSQGKDGLMILTRTFRGHNMSVPEE